MRSLILCMATSLDGFIEDADGRYDWCLTDQDYGMAAFLERIDTLLMGRKTFEAARGNPFPKKQCYVFSNKLSADTPGVSVVSEPAVPMVIDLKKKPGGDIWLFGGALLSRHLVEAGLVDEIWLAIHPILLGRGKPFLEQQQDRTKLRLKHSQAYSSGLVSVHYDVLPRESAEH